MFALWPSARARDDVLPIFFMARRKGQSPCPESSESDGRGADRANAPNPGPSVSSRLAHWLDALNAYLERVNKADLDTGC